MSKLALWLSLTGIILVGIYHYAVFFGMSHQNSILITGAAFTVFSFFTADFLRGVAEVGEGMPDRRAYILMVFQAGGILAGIFLAWWWVILAGAAIVVLAGVFSRRYRAQVNG